MNIQKFIHNLYPERLIYYIWYNVQHIIILYNFICSSIVSKQLEFNYGRLYELLCSAVCIENIHTGIGKKYNCMRNEDNDILLKILYSQSTKWYTIIHKHILNVEYILEVFINKEPSQIIYNFKEKMHCMQTLMFIYKRYVQYYKQEIAKRVMIPISIIDIISNYAYKTGLYDLSVLDTLIEEYEQKDDDFKLF